MSDMRIQSAGGAAWPQEQQAEQQAAAQQPEAAGTALLSPRDTYARQERETLADMMQDARKKIEAHRQSLQDLQKKTKPRYGDAPMLAYSKLSGARTKAQVTAAASYARRRIAQLRAALRQDSDSSAEIKSAIRQLQKAVGRAEKKKRELIREDQLERQQRRSQEQEEDQKAQRLKQELRRRRTSRVMRESGYLREAEIAGRLASQLTATQMELREQAASIGASIPSDAAAAQYAQAAAPAADASGGEISVEA